MKPELVYRDICRGYSELAWDGPVFVKHIDLLEESVLQEIYNSALQKALNLGAKSESQIIKELISAGSWTAMKETSIKSCETDIAQLEGSKRKICDIIQINGIYNAIEELKKKRLDLLEERHDLIKNSAEAFALGQMCEQKIIFTCFDDVNFVNKKFNDDFEYLESHKSNNLYNLYYELMGNFGGDGLKQLTINDFFWPLFTLSENIADFFRQPLYKLTINQANLLRYASNYSKVTSEIGDIPEEFAGNADKMVMYWYWKKNGGERAKDDQKETTNKLRNMFNSRK